MTTEPKTRHFRPAYWALVAWGATTSLLGAYLLAPHTVGLPVPSVHDPLLAASIAEDEPGSWLVTHVLLHGCECSAQVLETLRARPPREPVREQILLVGRADADDPALRSVGYVVRSILPEQLRARYGIEAAPVLIIRDPNGLLRYVGGYTVHRRDRVPHDREIVDRLVSEGRADMLPVLGCPASEELRASVDPLDIRPGPRGAELAAPRRRP